MSVPRPGSALTKVRSNLKPESTALLVYASYAVDPDPSVRIFESSEKVGAAPTSQPAGPFIMNQREIRSLCEMFNVTAKDVEAAAAICSSREQVVDRLLANKQSQRAPPQQPQPAPPAAAPTPGQVQGLMKMFPGMGEAQIMDAIRASSGNLHRAAEHLLTKVLAQPQTFAPDPVAAPQVRQQPTPLQQHVKSDIDTLCEEFPQIPQKTIMDAIRQYFTLDGARRWLLSRNAAAGTTTAASPTTASPGEGALPPPRLPPPPAKKAPPPPPPPAGFRAK